MIEVIIICFAEKQLIVAYSPKKRAFIDNTKLYPRLLEQLTNVIPF